MIERAPERRSGGDRRGAEPWRPVTGSDPVTSLHRK